MSSLEILANIGAAGLSCVVVMAMMSTKGLEDELGFYGAYHSNPWNQLIHFFFIPCIWWSICVFVCYVPFLPCRALGLGHVGGHPVTWGTVQFLAYSLFYVALDPLIGGLTSLLLLLLYMQASRAVARERAHDDAAEGKDEKKVDQKKEPQEEGPHKEVTEYKAATEYMAATVDLAAPAGKAATADDAVLVGKAATEVKAVTVDTAAIAGYEAIGDKAATVDEAVAANQVVPVGNAATANPYITEEYLLEEEADKKGMKNKKKEKPPAESPKKDFQAEVPKKEATGRKVAVEYKSEIVDKAGFVAAKETANDHANVDYAVMEDISSKKIPSKVEEEDQLQSQQPTMMCSTYKEDGPDSGCCNTTGHTCCQKDPKTDLCKQAKEGSRKSKMSWFIFAFILHALSWYMQLHPGHAVLEGVKPALVDSLGQALGVAPMFAFLEGVWFVGMLPDMHSRVLALVAENRAAMCAAGKPMPWC